MKKTKLITHFAQVLLFLLFANAGLVSAQDKPKDKEEFKPNGKVWGLVFADYFYKIHSDSLNRGNTQYANTAKNMNAVDFRRVYLGYDFNISEKFSTEFVLAYEPGTTLSDGVTRSFFLKAANIRWKNIFKNSDLVFGQMATPSYPMLTEKVWGYRSVEKTILDMRKIASSNDVGISLQGRFNDKGDYGYNFMIANGTSQKVPLNIFKRVYADVYAKFLNQKIIIDLYGDYYRSQLTPYHKSFYTVKAFAAFQSDLITAGVEAYFQPNENGAINAEPVSLRIDTVNTASLGFSVFVRGRIIKDKLGYFARFDSYNPDITFKGDRPYISGGQPNKEMFVTAGLDYSPHKSVHIIPNIWFDNYYSRSNNVSGVRKTDYDLAARVTVYYLFNK